MGQLGLEIVEKGKEEAAKYHKQSDFFLSSHTNLISFLFPHNNFDLLDLVAALCPTPGESNLCFLPQLKISSFFFPKDGRTEKQNYINWTVKSVKNS